MTSGFRGEVD